MARPARRQRTPTRSSLLTFRRAMQHRNSEYKPRRTMLSLVTPRVASPASLRKAARTTFMAAPTTGSNPAVGLPTTFLEMLRDRVDHSASQIVPALVLVVQ